MRTEQPQNLAKVGTVYGDVCYVERAAPADGKRMLRMYHANGKPMCERWPGCRDWRQKVLHPENVFLYGNPDLPAGWELLAEQRRERIIAEVCAQPMVTP